MQTDSILLRRFCSGECNLDDMYDASDGAGHCRWCGTEMSCAYPKDGRALVQRCCSAFCQIMHATVNRRYFDMPLKDGTCRLQSPRDVDFKLGAEELKRYGVDMHRRQFPAWYAKDMQDGVEYGNERRYCANDSGSAGRHYLPPDSSSRRMYCNDGCQQEAYRARRAA